MLIANNLTLIKDNKKIFESLGFCLSVGSCLIVRGGNGSGKTSLLKILAGIYKPTSGDVMWGEEKIEDLGTDFGGDSEFLGHDNFLKKELSVIDNINFHASLNGSIEAVNSGLGFFGISDLAYQKVRNLSAGQQKKVLLSKLLTCPSTVWFLDEPSINLDKEAKEKLYGLIKTRIKEDGLIVMATHDEMFFNLGNKLDMADF
ncbi:MAG: heme ABC exporter ATP-binding protein CcmA [Rickettsiales bacterium]|nr:heme ABC exporter ATP-binding protein CcmA [Rickettsiales bacterium]